MNERIEAVPPELAQFWRTEDCRTARERAEAFGIDLAQLAENLSMTPGERLAANDTALELVIALQSAKRQAET